MIHIQLVAFALTLIYKSIYGINICPENVISGKGTSALNDLMNYLVQDFGYNRSLSNRNSKLFYKDDTLINSKYAISTNTSNPVGFATMLIPMTDEERKVVEYKNLQILPIMATSIVIVYSLPNVQSLTLSMETLSDIYQGFITIWNDDRIKALNPGLKLPSAEIKVVARRDDTGATYVMTAALSDTNDKWNQNYGKFSSPNFIDEQCCNSTTWPEDVISYYASGGTGLIGIITSIPFTIGYVNLAIAVQSKLPYAAMINSANKSVLPSPDNVRAAINYFSWFNGDSLVYNLNNAKIPNAYPMVTYVYFVVDMKTHRNMSCCNMQETVAFLDWLISAVNSSVYYSYSFIPLPDFMVSQIRLTILQKIACNGLYVYEGYLASLRPATEILALWHIILIVASALILATVVGVVLFALKVQQKRKAEETKWFIPSGKVKANILFEAFHSSRSGTISSSSKHSSNDSANGDHSTPYRTSNLHNNNDAIIQSKHVLEVAEYESEAVYLQNLKTLPYPLLWKRVTKNLMLKFTQEIVHRNVNRIIGVILWQDSLHLVIDFSFKGTLHYVLQTCRYDLNDIVKYSLASDIASGMQHLTTKGVVHGSLSSISCYVDSSWTVKVGEWGPHSLCSAEGVANVEPTYPMEHTMEDSGFIRLLYKDFELQDKNTAKHDVFSFGMLLMEIFTRKLPYHDDIEEGILTYSHMLDEKFINHRHVEPRLETSNIPLKIVEMIKQCYQSINLRPSFTEIIVNLKKFKPSKKGIIDAMMDIVESHASDLQQKTSDLQNLNTRMEELLHEVLPPQIAIKLFNDEVVEPEQFENVTICFADVVGFTNISAKSNPREVMAFLNDLWVMFDGILHGFDAYKIDTIGDAYMVCSGLPQRNGNEHCKHIADLSLTLIEQCETFKIFHLPNETLSIRVGINSGSVTAGIVGSKMPQYCIFGDAVNVAARMQTTSLPRRIHVSEATYNLLNIHHRGYNLVKRGEIDVKGKGILTTYWLFNENRNQFSRNSVL